MLVGNFKPHLMNTQATDFRRDITKRPPPAKVGDFFYHNYGFEPITAFHKWEWSYTFGCWSGLVEFADGWRGYTYPSTIPTL